MKKLIWSLRKFYCLNPQTLINETEKVKLFGVRTRLSVDTFSFDPFLILFEIPLFLFSNCLELNFMIFVFMLVWNFMIFVLMLFGMSWFLFLCCWNLIILVFILFGISWYLFWRCFKISWFLPLDCLDIHNSWF